jgi:hypothetical protein
MSSGAVRCGAAALAAAVIPWCLLAAADPPRHPGPYVALRIDLYRGPADVPNAKSVGEQRGSGVVVGPAGGGKWLVLTNAHVVEAGDADRVVPQVFAGGRWRPGEVAASDAEADLALIRFEFPDGMRPADLSPTPPADHAEAETHGFAAGKTYTVRKAELRRDLPLGGGSFARAPHRYFMRSTFLPGESGGAVTIGGRLVAVIHGNDPKAGWGICVDQPSIAAFLKPYLRKPAAAGG